MDTSTIVAGSRSIQSYDVVRTAIEDSEIQVDELVSGKADGVDTLAEQWAEENDVPIAEFPWTEFTDEADERGIPAPIFRNEKMVEYGDALIAVWDGESNGTKHIINHARREGISVDVHRTDVTQLGDF